MSRIAIHRVEAVRYTQLRRFVERIRVLAHSLFQEREAELVFEPDDWRRIEDELVFRYRRDDRRFG